MKKYIIALVALFSIVSASAQNSNCCKNDGGCGFSPYWYLQGQGGIMLPYNTGDRGELLQPVFGVNLGRQVTSLVGVRLGVEGWNAKAKDKYVADKYNSYK